MTRAPDGRPDFLVVIRAIAAIVFLVAFIAEVANDLLGRPTNEILFGVTVGGLFTLLGIVGGEWLVRR